jgi:hypothetical protein
MFKLFICFSSSFPLMMHPLLFQQFYYHLTRLKRLAILFSSLGSISGLLAYFLTIMPFQIADFSYYFAAGNVLLTWSSLF